MTCIIQDPEGAYSIWASPPLANGLVVYEVQVGRAVYHNILSLATALALVGLPATGDALAGFIAAEER